MPFADDVRKYTFASLDHLVSKKGEEVHVHPYIPTEEQLEAMDNFVDTMDLMDAGEKDEEGYDPLLSFFGMMTLILEHFSSNRYPWFDTRDSYNPAVHRAKQALFHCAVVSDITTNPLPPPHPELLKYFEPPRRILRRARETTDECKDAFKVKQGPCFSRSSTTNHPEHGTPVPKRVARARKDGHVHAPEDDDGMLLLDLKNITEQTQPQIHFTQAEESTQSQAKQKVKENANDSDTEGEDEEEELLLDKRTPGEEPKRNNQPLPTPARSLSPQPDPGRAPGRIIGTTYPLADFKKNIAQGDVVSKAVEDLGVVIAEIVIRPFASRRKDELLECMQALRDTCLEAGQLSPFQIMPADGILM